MASEDVPSASWTWKPEEFATELQELRAELEASNPDFAKDTRDRDLHRFLVSRDGNVAKAAAMYTAYLKWREEFNIDAAEKEAPLWDKYTAFLPLQGTGFDNDGCPIMYGSVGRANYDAMYKYFDSTSWVPCHVHMLTSQLRRLPEANTRKGFPEDGPIDRFTTLLDLHGLGRSALKCVSLATAQFATDEKYFPEFTQQVFVVRAPWIFPVIYKLVRPFVDPHIRDRIHVLSGDPKDVLLQHMPLDAIPEELGGTAPNVRAAVVEDDAAAAGDEELVDPDNYVEVTVPAGSSHVKAVRIKEENPSCVVTWFFRLVEALDVEFSVEFVPLEAGEEVDLALIHERPAHVISQPVRHTGGQFLQGSFQPSGPGVLRIIWDNSYSWWHGKTIRFLVDEADLKEDRRHSIIDAPAVAAAGAAPPAATEE